MPEPDRRRRRPAVSCSTCRKRKLRCNRESPCSCCLRSKNSVCVYESHPPLQPRRRQQQFAEIQTQDSGEITNEPRSTPTNGGSEPSGDSPTSSFLSAQDLGISKLKLRLTEESMSLLTPTSLNSPSQSLKNGTSSSTEALESSMTESFDIHCVRQKSGQHLTLNRGVTHKTRLFGQSHWINGMTMFYDILKIFEFRQAGEIAEALRNIQRCKSMGKAIKARRVPRWPTQLTVDLPQKEITDELVECYLRTTETVYRVLHLPTFRKDYDAIWSSDGEPDSGFMVLLKLVLAIGATTYDEQFTLRTSAIRWVYEAQTWMSDPKFKLRLSMQSLQTNILLILAGEITGIGGDSIWISAGSLLRRAIYMGLHRDPACLPKGSLLSSEMRRRLWNTVLEISLQSSLTAGESPLISLEEFDTEPPGNFNDEELLAEKSVPKQVTELTSMSIAIALRETFPIRLAVARFLNNICASITYEEALRFDTQMRTAYKALCQTMQKCSSSTGPSPSRFGTRMLDYIMQRFLYSIHTPFFGPSLRKAEYAFSRKVSVETAVKIWYAIRPSSSSLQALCRNNTSPSERDDLARLTICGSGFYRSVATQAITTIGAELIAQLMDEESFHPTLSRPDLLCVLDDAKTWSLQCIEAGYTSMKGYLLVCLITAKIEGLMQGLGRDEMAKLVVKTATDAGALCMPMLEKMAADCQAEMSFDETQQTSLGTASVMTEDWDFTMPEDLFSMGYYMESMNFSFNSSNYDSPQLPPGALH